MAKEESNIQEFHIGDDIHFKGKNLKPSKILKEVLSDRLVEKYLKGYVQARITTKSLDYVG